MKKFWIVYGVKNDGKFERFESYEDASNHAKRLTASSQNDHVILEAVGIAKMPVPNINVEKL